MPRGFTKEEEDAIRKKLIKACEKLSAKYGYKKTSVGDICKEVGISVGSFYKFFENKEMLYIEVAEILHQEIYDEIITNKPENPKKEDIAMLLKTIFTKYLLNPDFLSIHKDFLYIIDNLPKQYVTSHLEKDLLDVESVINLYGLKPKIEMETVLAILHTLFTSVYNYELIGAKFDEAICILIDVSVNHIFE